MNKLPAEFPHEQWEEGIIKTKNQMGIMTIEFSPPTKAFIEYCREASNPVLDIGCAYGLSSLAALRAGAFVYACDLEKEHLTTLTAMADKEGLANLKTFTASFPDELEFEPDSLSAVHLSMIIHFLPAEVSLRGLKKCHQWLMPGGKLFIGNMTPYHGVFDNDPLLKEYQRRVEQGEEWPGEIKQHDFLKDKETWQDSLPDTAHFFMKESMEKLATLAGFRVEQLDYYTLDNIPKEYKTNGKEYVGLQASKG